MDTPGGGTGQYSHLKRRRGGMLKRLIGMREKIMEGDSLILEETRTSF